MNNKIIVSCLLILGLCFSSFAQDKEYETIFSKRANRKSPNFRLYGEIINSYNPLFSNKKTYHRFGDGVGFGLTYKKKYSAGLGFISIGNMPDEIIGSIDGNTTVKPFQFGLSFSYKPKPQDAIHMVYNIYTGGLNILELRLQNDASFDVSKVVGYYVNPNVKLEANVMSWLAINLGLGYRLTGGKDDFGVNISKHLGGPHISIGFKFEKLR